jgi:hypothetical protein
MFKLQKISNRNYNKNNKFINTIDDLINIILTYINSCILKEELFLTCKFFNILLTQKNNICKDYCSIKKYTKFKKILDIKDKYYCCCHQNEKSKMYNFLKSNYKMYLKNITNDNIKSKWINLHFKIQEEAELFFQKFCYSRYIFVKRSGPNKKFIYDYCCGGKGLYIKLVLN